MEGEQSTRHPPNNRKSLGSNRSRRRHRPPKGAKIEVQDTEKHNHKHKKRTWAKKQRTTATKIEQKLRPDAIAWEPGVGFLSYANKTRTVGKDSESQHALVDPLPQKEDNAVAMVSLTRQSKVYKTDKLFQKFQRHAETKMDQRRDEDVIRDVQEKAELVARQQVAESFVSAVMSQAIEHVKAEDAKKRRLAAKKRFNRLFVKWRGHCEASNVTMDFELEELELKRKKKLNKQQEQCALQSSLLPSAGSQRSQLVQDKIDRLQQGPSNFVGLVEFLQACESGDLQTVLHWGNQRLGDGETLSRTLNNTGDVFEETPLALAIKSQHLETVEMLVEWGAALTIQKFRSGKKSATTSALHYASSLGNDSVVRLLLNSIQYNAHRLVLLRDSHGQTPLHLACMDDHHACARVLLEHGASLLEKDKEGNTALHYAARVRNSACAELLLNFSGGGRSAALVNTRNKNGETPLHIAAKAGNDTVVAALLSCGALPNILDRQSLSPLCHSLESGSLSTIELLSVRGGKVQHVHYLDDEDDNGAATKLSFAPSVLNHAAVQGNWQAVDLLLRLHDFSIDSKEEMWPCDTPLMSACRATKWSCALALVETLGADACLLNNRKESALQVALAAAKSTEQIVPLALVHALANPKVFQLEDPFKDSPYAESSLEIALDLLLQVTHPSRSHLVAAPTTELSSQEANVLEIVFLLLRKGASVTAVASARMKEFIQVVCKRKFDEFVQARRSKLVNRSTISRSAKVKKDAGGRQVCGLQYAAEMTPAMAERQANLKRIMDPTFHRDLSDLFDATVHNNAMFGDVVIELEDGRVVMGHRVVLSSRCPYFAGMFANDLQETQLLRIDFSAHPRDTALRFFRFLYDGRIQRLPFVSFARQVVSPKDVIGGKRPQPRDVLDGQRVVEQLQEAVNMMVLCNEMLVKHLEEICAMCIEIILVGHVVSSHIAKHSRKRLDASHVRDLLACAEAWNAPRLQRVCEDLLRFMDTGLLPARIHEAGPLHPIQCCCPSDFLIQNNLRYWYVEEKGFTVDVLRVCHTLELSLDDLFHVRPIHFFSLLHSVAGQAPFTSLGRRGGVSPAALYCGFFVDAIETEEQYPSAVRVETALREAFDACTSFESLNEALQADVLPGSGQLPPCRAYGPDLELIVDDSGRCLVAHRSILAMRSKTFLDLFTDKDAMHAQLDCRSLGEKSFSRVSWKQILHFCYTGRFQQRHLPQSIEETIDLFELAELLQLPFAVVVLEALLDASPWQRLSTRGGFEPPHDFSVADVFGIQPLHPCLWSLETQYRCSLLEVKDLDSVFLPDTLVRRHLALLESKDRVHDLAQLATLALSFFTVPPNKEALS